MPWEDLCLAPTDLRQSRSEGQSSRFLSCMQGHTSSDAAACHLPTDVTFPQSSEPWFLEALWYRTV
jgi:hypothetical protein